MSSRAIFDEAWLADYQAKTRARQPLVPRHPVPNARVSLAGHDGERGSCPAVGDTACAAATAVKLGPGEGEVTSAGHVREPRQPIQRQGLVSRGKNRRPEEALQTAIVAYWRPKLVPGARLLATNGELPGGAEQARRAARRKGMGYTRGTPDTLCARPGALVWLEVKVKGNYPTAEQADFAQWARDCGHGWAVVQSVEDAGAVLSAYGMLA